MKILLINFNVDSTPGINNGLAILSAVLKKKGHQLKLLFVCEELDYSFDLSRMKNDILDFSPQIIGISLMEPQFKYMVRFCNDVRNYYKGFVICGGSYPTMAPEDVIAIKGVDAVCVGEGEDAVCELTEALEKNSDYNHIKNLYVKLSNGDVIKNRLRPFKDLSKLPAEDKELFDLNKLLPIKNYQLEVMVSRGCLYACSYCINRSYIDQYRNLCDKTISAKQYIRIKNINTVIKEIKEAISKYPQIKKIAFIDDNFLMHDSFLKDFCREYKREVELPFVCNINPMSFSHYKGRVLKKAGCDDIRFGVESGSDRIKKDIIKRPIANRAIINAFKIANKLGIMTSSFNMIGIPTEKKSEVLDTLKLNAILLPDTIKVMTFYPFKSTPLYDLCVKLNLIDYGKKNELSNYDTSTCLKFPSKYRLFLRKIQAAFNWYINVFLNNAASSEYQELVNAIEAMNEGEWGNFDFESADMKMSQKLKKRNITHYSKFVNRSLAVKFPSRHALL